MLHLQWRFLLRRTGSCVALSDVTESPNPSVCLDVCVRTGTHLPNVI